MNNKKAVEKKIRELVPSLIGLSTGCKVRMFNREMTLLNIISHENGNHTVSYIAPNGTEHNGTYSIYEVENIEIIGHPIHLEHVVCAIKNHLGVPPQERQLFTKSACTASILAMFNRYAWEKPFTEQSEDLYKFVANILNV